MPRMNDIYLVNELELNGKSFKYKQLIETTKIIVIKNKK